MLLGSLTGGALCICYLRQDVVANLSPGLRQIQLRLETMDAEINLALATRQAELSKPAHPQIPPDSDSAAP